MKNIIAKEIINISLEKEIQSSYLNYAMSVIIGRALPDVRDGLKPVHRRILYAMFLLKNFYNKSYKKSARIVGDVIGKYHPHGDNAVYESIVRMAQNFIIRYPLIDGQGNFGSIDGDSAAAMRYTEIRMSKIAQELLFDIDKNTVKFINNYDNTEFMPLILPARIPNLLINGSSGIAVGMATNIPPHNIKEILNACLAYIKNRDISIKEIIKYIPGPDFPTGGIIYSKSKIEKAYILGKGQLIIRMKYKIKKINNKINIIIYELPYLVNKSNLLIKITDLIKNNKIDGIEKVKDESDKDGLNIKLQLKKNFSVKSIINNLFLLTPLQSFFNINMVALINNQPKLMNLKELISNFINFRCEIIINKFIFLLKKYKQKLHILEGLLIVINNLNIVINIIKSSNDTKKAANKLINMNFEVLILNKKIKNYILSNIQIKAILNLKLQRLTNIEQKNILIKYQFLLNEIKKINNLLNNNEVLMNFLTNELLELKKSFNDKRKSIISNNFINIITEDLIDKQDIVIIITLKGFIKYEFLYNFNVDKKGNRGKLFFKISKKDTIIKIIVSDTYKYLLCLSNLGKLYKLKILDITKINNIKNNIKLINNLLLLNNSEYICSTININNTIKLHNYYLIIITNYGYIKKISLLINKNITNLKNKGIIVILLHPNDKINNSILTKGNNNIIIFTANGKFLYFKEIDIKFTNRNSYGYKGIKLCKNDQVKSIISINSNNKEIFLITENGYGKRLLIEFFTIQSKGLKGLLCLPLNIHKGKLITAIKINQIDHIIIITNLGNIIRLKVKDIPLLKRQNQARSIIKLKKNEKVIDVKRIII